MSINFEKELNTEQLHVVREASGPSLVLAGAGSGKTRTIVYRVFHLLEQGIHPEEILLLTFTNKAARAMMGRVELLVGSGLQKLWGGTFHHVAARVLRKYGHLLGYRPNYTILDEDDSRSLIKLATSESGLDPKSRRFPSPGVLQSIFSFSRNSGRSLDQAISYKYSNWLKVEQEIKDIFATYTDKKRQGNLMDFDDLMLNFVLLLRAQTSVREVLRAKWKHILVDEYQDTNALQGELVRLLYSDWQQGNIMKSVSQAEQHGCSPGVNCEAENRAAFRALGGTTASFQNITLPPARSLLVVGDDAQSIYSFRGATIDNILEFPRIFKGTKIFRLETNYRSSTPILNLANAVIAANARQHEKKLHGIRAVGEKPNLIIANSAEDEAKFIAEKILELHGSGIGRQNIAVLFRAAYQSEMLEFELAKRDIPYEYRGGVRFFERAHIKDVLAYLRVLSNWQDEISWLRILNMMPGIGEVTASRIFSLIRESKNFNDVINQNFSIQRERADQGWGDTRKFLKKLMTLGQASPKDIIEAILNSGYQDYLENQYPNWQERLDDLEQLKIFAASYDNLVEFVGELSLYEHFGARRAANAPSDREMLVLSTIHQAKGLEWEAVFLLGLTAAAFPNRRALSEDGGVEEERRLFYVAITRARRFLFLSYPLVSGLDSAYLNQPSMFLNEIDQDLLKVTQIMRDGGHDDDDIDFPTISLGKKELLPRVREL